MTLPLLVLISLAGGLYLGVNTGLIALVCGCGDTKWSELPMWIRLGGLMSPWIPYPGTVEIRLQQLQVAFSFLLVFLAVGSISLTAMLEVGSTTASRIFSAVLADGAFIIVWAGSSLWLRWWLLNRWCPDHQFQREKR